ncbi:uncharacterized protein [Montipora foliosa]|uniref:uncharacterized protein n=1 Tax=Montipora foliosa TaxID=591990 RepID=UPI0035F12D25
MNGRWLKGPEFLQTEEARWPVEAGSPDSIEVNKEGRRIQIACPVTVSEPILNCEDFSSWRRLIRVTAYVRRFCQNLRSKLKRVDCNQKGNVGPLNALEIEDAEEYWLKFAQSDLPKKMQRGDFKTLTAYADENGIIRVGGRVDPSLLSYDNTRPVLLQYKHWISMLVTRQAHQYGHSGVAATTAKCRRKYWIVRGHNLSRVVKRKCTFCREFEAKAKSQLMADLPSCRLQPYTPAFHHTACDYFGPIKEQDSKALWSDFHEVLRRFFSYRGYPELMISDNGSQMVGAERELHVMIKGWDGNQPKEYCADRGMKWQFTTPLAPHQNGCSESIVKSTKSALKKAIGETILTLMELYTCLLEVANLLNQRPIGKLSEDPDDGTYLCPNDILLGRATSTVPQ